MRKDEKKKHGGKDTVYSDYLKLLMNSLYGKFGQGVKEKVEIFSHIS